jgi:hypothetical protein
MSLALVVALRLSQARHGAELPAGHSGLRAREFSPFSSVDTLDMPVIGFRRCPNLSSYARGLVHRRSSQGERSAMATSLSTRVPLHRPLRLSPGWCTDESALRQLAAKTIHDSD